MNRNSIITYFSYISDNVFCDDVSVIKREIYSIIFISRSTLCHIFNRTRMSVAMCRSYHRITNRIQNLFNIIIVIYTHLGKLIFLASVVHDNYIHIQRQHTNWTNRTFLLMFALLIQIHISCCAITLFRLPSIIVISLHVKV